MASLSQIVSEVKLEIDVAEEPEPQWKMQYCNSDESAATESTPKAKRFRKPNFSLEELRILLLEIARARRVILSCRTNEVTNKQKMEVWRKIAHKVSACGVSDRSVEELRDKWKNLKRETLRRQEDQKKSGGGPQPAAYGRPAPFDDLLLTILGKKTGVEEDVSASVPSVFTPSEWPSAESDIQLLMDCTSGGSCLDASFTSAPCVPEDKNHSHDASADHPSTPFSSPESSTQEQPAPRASCQLKRKPAEFPYKRKGSVDVCCDVKKHFFQSQMEVNKEWLQVLPALRRTLESQERLAVLKERLLMLQVKKLELEIEKEKGGKERQEKGEKE